MHAHIYVVEGFERITKKQFFKDKLVDWCIYGFLICSFTCLYSQRTSLPKRKPKRMPPSLYWMRLYLCIDGTVTRKCTLAATSIQEEESISSSLTTPILCGGQNQSTTESIIPDKDANKVWNLGLGRIRCLTWKFLLTLDGALESVLTLLILV